MLNMGPSPLQISAAPRAVCNAAATKYINLYYKYNIMLQNEEVCGNTIHSSSEASGVNHIIHPKAEVNNDLFSTKAKPDQKTWYYHALLSYVTILATK